jgi:8-oxo-dGTP pyrophosphatase MutT (NUDIX family)
LVERGDTLEETALNEAWEEAGLTGSLLGRTLGTYQYQKWGTTLTVAVYLMAVAAQDRVWEESSFRERKWMSLDAAEAALKQHPVRPLLDRAKRLLARSH